MYKLIASLLTMALLSSCSLTNNNTPTTEPPTEHSEDSNITNNPDTTDPSTTSYEQLWLNFIEISNSFDYNSIVSGFETREVFLSLNTALNNILLERESITDNELEKFINPETGFLVLFSESIKQNNYSYRFVLLTNEYRERIMAGGSFLSLQYWSDEDIGYHPLAISITNSGEFTDFLDYRFIPNTNIISVVQLRHSDISLNEYTFNLFLFKFNGKDFENCDPLIERGGNEKWNVSSNIYKFYDKADDVRGLDIRENTEEDNAYKVDIEISDNELTFLNLENVKSQITLELSGCAWTVKNE